MTLKQAATLTGYSPDHLRVLIYRKELRATKKGRDWHITREALDSLMLKKGKTLGGDCS